MKNLLFILALLICLSAKGQSRMHYFKVDAEFRTMDNCEHTTHLEITCNSISYVTYDLVLKSTQKWIKPEKLKNGSFKITGIEEVPNKKGWVGSKKFEPCKQFDFSDFSDGISSSTAIVGNLDTPYHFAIKTFDNTFNPVITISPPDTAKIVTVILYKSKLKQINDSTYTFKQIQ